MKKLFLLPLLFGGGLLFYSINNKNSLQEFDYKEGKIELQKNNYQLKDYTQLKTLFDTVKNRFTKDFKALKPFKIVFLENNKGCTVIADSFMEFAGSSIFDENGTFKNVNFGEGYVCSYANIECTDECENVSRNIRSSFHFYSHRVVKFKLKDSTEYVFDMVISEEKPMKFDEWIEKYTTYNNKLKPEHSETTLVQSLGDDPTYSSNNEDRLKKIGIILKQNPDSPVK
jgi:hypothetical protein